jgi:Kef-type K+ transport system membrane component KefB
MNAAPDPIHAATQGASTLAVLGALALVLVGARAGAVLFRRIGQPAVLGELAVGIAIGNLGLLGVHGWEALRTLPGLDLLAEIGVLFLLFMTGLESELGALLEVGASSLLVATLGVVAPITLGFFAARALEPSQPPLVHLFVGATLCATSVGITARVLNELGRASSPAGRIILGAAVIDDVLGLVVLAVVAGLIRAADGGATFHAVAALAIVAKAVAFLAGAIAVGGWLSRRTLRMAARGDAPGLTLSLALGVCFALSWLAGWLGLAPIVGAFSAGLILEGGSTAPSRDAARQSIADQIRPLSSFLTPVFFVLMGMRVDLTAFARTDVLALAAALTLAAVAGKQVCALGVITPGVDRLAVGFGMIPRGEVGLIFAGIGASLMLAGVPVVDGRRYAAIVMMVAITTLLAPPLLAWRLSRKT